MGLRIDSNVQGLLAQRQAQQTSNRLLDGLRQLSAQERITQAADDAAGLAIAEQFRGQILQFTQETANLQSGISLAQTAEGGLGAQQEAVGRIRELALQASNGTLTQEQRDALNQEAQQLLEQIDETAANTEFNGRNPLDGSLAGGLELNAGGGETVTVDESTTTSLGLSGLDLSTAAGAQTAVDQTNTTLSRISQNRAGLGAQSNRFEHAIEVREVGVQNAAESESRIRDLDVARATIEQTRNQLLLQASVSAIHRGGVTSQRALDLLTG